MIRPMNDWIVSKLLSYLSSKEGCTVLDYSNTEYGIKANIVDSFGFVYEVQVKALSRAANTANEVEVYEQTSNGTFLSVTKG